MLPILLSKQEKIILNDILAVLTENKTPKISPFSAIKLKAAFNKGRSIYSKLHTTCRELPSYNQALKDLAVNSYTKAITSMVLEKPILDLGTQLSNLTKQKAFYVFGIRLLVSIILATLWDNSSFVKLISKAGVDSVKLRQLEEKIECEGDSIKAIIHFCKFAQESQGQTLDKQLETLDKAASFVPKIRFYKLDSYLLEKVAVIFKTRASLYKEQAKLTGATWDLLLRAAVALSDYATFLQKYNLEAKAIEYYIEALNAYRKGFSSQPKDFLVNGEKLLEGLGIFIKNIRNFLEQLEEKVSIALSKSKVAHRSTYNMSSYVSVLESILGILDQLNQYVSGFAKIKTIVDQYGKVISAIKQVSDVLSRLQQDISGTIGQLRTLTYQMVSEAGIIDQAKHAHVSVPSNIYSNIANSQAVIKPFRKKVQEYLNILKEADILITEAKAQLEGIYVRYTNIVLAYTSISKKRGLWQEVEDLLKEGLTTVQILSSVNQKYKQLVKTWYKKLIEALNMQGKEEESLKFQKQMQELV